MSSLRTLLSVCEDESTKFLPDDEYEMKFLTVLVVVVLYEIIPPSPKVWQFDELMKQVRIQRGEIPAENSDVENEENNGEENNG